MYLKTHFNSERGLFYLFRYVALLPKIRQALVEFEDIDNAVSLVCFAQVGIYGQVFLLNNNQHDKGGCGHFSDKKIYLNSFQYRTLYILQTAKISLIFLGQSYCSTWSSNVRKLFEKSRN